MNLTLKINYMKNLKFSLLKLEDFNPSKELIESLKNKEPRVFLEIPEISNTYKEMEEVKKQGRRYFRELIGFNPTYFEFFKGTIKMN
jgi:hypothetical protein